MNLSALWHDLECAGYRDDLSLWRALAAEAGGPVLDVGAGTGRVTLDLAARGASVVAMDVDAPLLEALDHRAAGLSVETVVADAREFALSRAFSLVLVPMQTLQLLGGATVARPSSPRAGAPRPGGWWPPRWPTRWTASTPNTTRRRRLTRADRRRALFQSAARGPRQGRSRGHPPPSGDHRTGRAPRTHDIVVELDRVSADEVATEAGQLGFTAEPHLYVQRPSSTSERRWSSSRAAVHAIGVMPRLRRGPTFSATGPLQEAHHEHANASHRHPIRTRGWSYEQSDGAGWVLFAGIMLAMVGRAEPGLRDRRRFELDVFVNDAKFILSDLNTWGWVLIVVGVVQGLRPLGVVPGPGRPLARRHDRRLERDRPDVLHLRVPAPVRTLFALDILVIYGLAVHGARLNRAA